MIYLMSHPVAYIHTFSSIRLRSYQTAVIEAVTQSVLCKRGLSFAVLFPRQSGKNLLQAQIETYLLDLLQHHDAALIKISPTWRPQSLNAIQRLEQALEGNLHSRGKWRKESGYIFRIGRARILFLSGAPHSNIVGATASTLLEVDEAQQVEIAKFDKDIAPMAASTNATRVFWGTAWTSRTLLAREVRAARQAEQHDGQRRVFITDADQVAREVPDYERYVAEQVARLGRNHPMVRTQYFSEEIDSDGGMFPSDRRSRLAGSHDPCEQPRAGRLYAFLLDVAGADESADANASPYESSLRNPARDASALTVVEVDLSTCQDPLLRAPTYRCVQRRLWLGAHHSSLYADLRGLAETWRAHLLVVDATGVGAGLAGFLERALPGRVLPFLFNTSSKSQLGWDFLTIVDSGRWKEPVYPAGGDRLQNLFWLQLEHCQYQILPGPERRMRWGVPDGTRDPASGELVHDDLLISAALSALLDWQPWTTGGETLVVAGKDPLSDLDRGF